MTASPRCWSPRRRRRRPPPWAARCRLAVVTTVPPWAARPSNTRSNSRPCLVCGLPRRRVHRRSHRGGSRRVRSRREGPGPDGLRSRQPGSRPVLTTSAGRCETGAMSPSPRFRSVLDDFPAYQPGRTPVSSTGKTHKLSSNESPFEPLPSVLKAIIEAAQSVNQYPDNGALALIEAIAERFGVPQQHAAAGRGSLGATKPPLEAVGEPGAEVMYAWLSFEAYPTLADLAAAESVRVPLRDETHDLAAMADAITPRTRLIFVCNPNNPTGTVVHADELGAFLDRVPPDCLVVLDEAYHEYIRDEAVPDGMRLYRDRPNLAVLRTFSKAYGLAGLRVGSLAAEDELLERVELTVKERTRVREALVADGWTVPPTEANFVWLRLGEHTAAFAAACEAEGIAVRPFGAEGARVTIGDPEANDTLLTIARSFPHRHP